MHPEDYEQAMWEVLTDAKRNRWLFKHAPEEYIEELRDDLHEAFEEVWEAGK